MIVDCAVYEDGCRCAGGLPLDEAGQAAQRDGSFVWLGVYEPSEEEFDAVRREFDLHELAVEDAVHAHQRPKVELYGDTLLVVLKTARDVHDHLLRVSGQIESFRDLLSSALQANLTQVAVRQNDDMRKISAWVAILAVPTGVAAIYGMNFDTMPELDWAFGYPSVLILIVVICSVLYRRFRRSGWL